MTSRRAGLAVIASGLAVAAWAWTGAWPWGAPAIYRGSDFAAINSVGLAVALLGCVGAVVGVLLLFGGRGGPPDRAGR
jgi:hypothetical protein